MLVFRAGSPKIPIFYNSLLTPLSETGGEGRINMIVCLSDSVQGWGVECVCVGGGGGGGGGGVCMCTCTCTFVCVCTVFVCVLVCVRANVCVHFCAQFRYEVQMIGLPFVHSPRLPFPKRLKSPRTQYTSRKVLKLSRFINNDLQPCTM